MALDTTMCLEEIRAAIKSFKDQHSMPDNEIIALDTAAHIIEHVRHLDEELSAGEVLPKWWQAKS